VIVLIHGFCASNLVWREILLPLAEAGFRVIAPDLVGFGFTEKPRNGEFGAYTIAAQSRMIIRLLDKLGIERATLAGSSYGGAVASFVALDHAERVERLVLVSAVTNDDVKNQRLLRLAAAPVMGDLLSPLMLGSPRLMRWRMRKVYEAGGGPVRTEENMLAHHRPLRYANTHRAVLRTLRRWDATRIEREAANITQPTLLVWGEGDTDVPLKNGFHLHTLLPNSRLIVFRHCGHLPQEEHPREFTEVVMKWITDSG
jgi:pimeloyl-ACP methyl ester carboxylesterase